MVRRRFTLVELLVVIAIIGVLAALLMPALRNALGIARDTSCLNNMRQISMLVMQYGDNNNGCMPPDRIHNSKLPEAAGVGGLSSYYYWQNYLLPYYQSNLSRLSSFTVSATVDGRTVKMPSLVFGCPATSFSDVYNLYTVDGSTQVLTNCKMGIAFNANANWGPVIARVAVPSKTFLIMDMLGGAGTDQPCVASQLYSWGGGYGYPMWFSSYGIRPRHGGGYCLNTAFIDSHADMMEYGKIPNSYKNAAGFKWIMAAK